MVARVLLRSSIVTKEDQSAALMASMIQLNRYTLLEKIGSSTLGAVYKAQDTWSGCLVALKVLQLGLLDDVSSSEMDARLQRNFEAASRLRHPGIARVFEIRRDGRTALIATELVEGPRITSLAQRVTASDVSQVVAACIQLLEALDFAHNQSLIHRDLKPSNVLIQGGSVKITDFGMSDLGARNRTETGALVGEAEYMAPEQFLSGTIDKRCDIHAVGTILYELLSGKSPFRGDPNTAFAMFKVLDFVPPPPSQIRSGLPPAFDKLVARALAKEPAQRFVTAREFRNELFAAYVALAGRPPPESLFPVDSEPRTAQAEAPRTTLIQARPTPPAPGASPDDDERSELSPAKPLAGNGLIERAEVAPQAVPALGELRASESRMSDPLPGGTVLVRPKAAGATEPAPAPVVSVPAQPVPVRGDTLPAGTVLASNGSGATDPSAAPEVTAPPQAAGAGPPLPKRIIPLTAESITHGGRVLAQFIGPIAMVFSRRAAEAAHDERGYFEMLAAHLTDPNERAQFLRKLRQRPA